MDIIVHRTISSFRRFLSSYLLLDLQPRRYWNFFSHQLNDSTSDNNTHFVPFCVYIYAVIFQYYKDKEDRSFFKIRVYGNYAYVIPLLMHFSF